MNQSLNHVETTEYRYCHNTQGASVFYPSRKGLDPDSKGLTDHNLSHNLSYLLYCIHCVMLHKIFEIEIKRRHLFYFQIGGTQN